MSQGIRKTVEGVVGLTFKYGAGRICLENEQGRTVGEVTFPTIDKNTVEIDHTYVDPALRGKGLAAQLVKAAVEQIRKEGKKAVPTCSYVRAQFKEKPEYQSLLSDRKN